MAFVTPAQTSFNGGEQSPRILSRIDQSIHSIGVRKMHGWLPLLSGVAEACPGTIFVAKGKSPDCVLIPFEFNVTQGYQIELGQNYARFFTNDAQIMDGGAPVEIATPWTFAQAKALYYQQSLDVLYCAHPEVPLHVIKRVGADEFVCEPYALKAGPFEARNADKGVTVQASATTGSVTITASHPIFAAGDVGGLMEIESPAFGEVPAWEAGMALGTGGVWGLGGVAMTGMLVQSNGNVYRHVGGANRTGTVAPIHTEGTEYDGMGGKDVNDKGPYGAAWAFEYGMFGLVRFTGYTSPTQMTATVIDRLPTIYGSWRWRFGAFSTRRGFPAVVGVWQERLILAKDATVYGSVAGALDDFAPRNELGDISRDQAFTYPLPTADTIRWVLDDLQLVVGTDKQEHVIFAASAGQGAGPGNLDRSVPADNGSRATRPVKVNGRALHIQKSGGKVVQLAYDSNRLLRAGSPNLSRFADHIGGKGKRLMEMAWLQEPERHLWFRRQDGTLAVMGYDPDEQFVAWATRALGGGLTVQSISVNTDPAGEVEQLWMVARAGGESWILRMAPLRGSDDASEQVMVDAAVRRTGTASTAVSAPHLAGRMVDICADGRPIMAVKLDGAGAITLPFAAADVIVGLRYDAEIELLPPSGGSENGPALGKKKRPHRIDLHVNHSDELEVECEGGIERINLLQSERSLDVSLPLFTGQQRLEPAADYDGDMAIKIRRIYPRPSTLAIVMPFYESAQA